MFNILNIFQYRLASVVQCLLAFAIFITHGLACYVAIDILWNEYIGVRLLNSNHRLLWEYILRTLIVLVTCKFPFTCTYVTIFVKLYIVIIYSIQLYIINLFINLRTVYKTYTYSNITNITTTRA